MPYVRSGLSPVEIEQRLGQSWERVRNTDPAVRAAFSSFYGTLAGDAALAATFLDPTRTVSALEKQSRAAYTSGMGQRLGIDLDQEVSERIAGLPRTEAGIYENLTQLNQLQGSGIFDEGITETSDLSTQNTGVAAVFDGDGKAAQALERRTIERNAARASVPGGAIRTQRGATGLGEG